MLENVSRKMMRQVVTRPNAIERNAYALTLSPSPSSREDEGV